MIEKSVSQKNILYSKQQSIKKEEDGGYLKGKKSDD